MSKLTVESGSDLNTDENNGSFKFAISLIVFILTILYRLYIYADSNPIRGYTEILAIFFSIIVIVAVLICMIIYLLAKAVCYGGKKFRN